VASITEVFPSEDPVARFMVTTAMARNDVRHAIFKAGEANTGSRPEFAYWVRLSTGHFFEAAHAIERWRQVSEIGEFISALPEPAQVELKKVTTSLEELGRRVLAHSRNRTFHYPYPSSRYPTDAELKRALKELGEQQAEWLDQGDGRFRLKFADDVALLLSLGKHDQDKSSGSSSWHATDQSPLSTS
jgi:hypothetical protein